MADDTCDHCGGPMSEHHLELELAVPVDDLRAFTLTAIFALAALDDPEHADEAKEEVRARLEANHGGTEGLQRLLDEAQASIRSGIAAMRQHTARNN